MNKILIIEKESAYANSIAKLAKALNFYPYILLNWKASANSPPKNEIAAIFVNVEMPLIRISEVVEFANQNVKSNSNSIPLFFLFAHEYSNLYQRYLELPHTGELKKPFQMEEVYYIFQQHLNETRIKHEDYLLNSKLSQYEEFSTEFNNWLRSFRDLMNK